ncbi:hypothetical protein ABZY19_33700, partial [Streptomyces sp. NPDC006475]|uniref:hypothetical protein n=1 Tax=Streptomyces sp. NPDC006475 TaxID=3155719 RepID=UPI0033A6429D
STMNDQTMRDEATRPVFASLHMPQQTPPIDRTSASPGGTGDDTSGVEADFLPLLAPLLSLFA